VIFEVPDRAEIEVAMVEEERSSAKISPEEHEITVPSIKSAHTA